MGTRIEAGEGLTTDQIKSYLKEQGDPYILVGLLKKHTIFIQKCKIDPNELQVVICNYFDQDYNEYISCKRCKKTELVRIRQLSMYFLKKYTRLNLTHIGLMVAEKDHATVLYSCKAINDMMDTYKKFKAQVDELDTIIRETLLKPKDAQEVPEGQLR